VLTLLCLEASTQVNGWAGLRIGRENIKATGVKRQDVSLDENEPRKIFIPLLCALGHGVLYQLGHWVASDRVYSEHK
jgi:hypothetical protein